MTVEYAPDRVLVHPDLDTNSAYTWNLLIEETDGRLEHSKIGHIAVRTMEFFRRWGIARAVREVESAAERGAKVSPSNRTKFQVAALLVRDERARIEAHTGRPLTEAWLADFRDRRDVQLRQRLAESFEAALRLADGRALVAEAESLIVRGGRRMKPLAMATFRIVPTGAPSLHGRRPRSVS